MNNVIIKDNGDIMGYYEDVARYLEDTIRTAIDIKSYDEIGMVADVLMDLKPYEKSDKLLVVSENNGMGITVKENEL